MQEAGHQLVNSRYNVHGATILHAVEYIPSNRIKNQNRYNVKHTAFRLPCELLLLHIVINLRGPTLSNKSKPPNLMKTIFKRLTQTQELSMDKI